MKRLNIIVCAVVASIFLTGCEQKAAREEAPARMPFKENTWVRKETVTKSTDSIPSAMNSKPIEALAVDDSLAKKLKTVSNSISVNSETDCLDQADELDQRRTEVQKRGGLWRSFEKAPEAKKYSSYGMQLDSQVNRMVFSLKYLCRASKGMPLDGWGRKIVDQLEKEGKEKLRESKIEMGNAPADVDKWIAYAEMAVESKKRDIPFAKIGESIARSKNMVELYEKLSLQRVDEDTLRTFFTQSSTLLSAINDSLVSDPNLALSVREENSRSIAVDDIEGEL